MIEIRYISALCSKKVLDYIFETSREKPQLAAQKFHRLLAEGFSQHGDKCKIETLSTIPVVPDKHPRKFWNLPSERSNNLTYNYIPMLNVPFIKNVGVFFYTFFRMFFWSLTNNKKNRKVILCDVLNLSIAAASLLASKFTFTKNIAVVTDIPGLMVVDKKLKMSLKGRLYTKMVSYILSRFTGYVLLTEQMNPVVNTKDKPYMIMEGLVDINMDRKNNSLQQKSKEKIVIYAGGLFEKYGIKTLIEGFIKLNDPSVRLHLYGPGDMVPDIKEYYNKDPRVIYMGLVPNQIVVEDQIKATLLVNPRPTKEEFTKFSFPSKNMEYMVSATPVATTKLPGMPEEYHPYIYLFDDESVEGIHHSLEHILSIPKEELHKFGERAKDFVLENKNNVIQARRILDFLS